MERKLYEPTEKQIEKWNAMGPAAMPSDEEFKETWKRRHGGRERGWGIAKRNYILSNMTRCREYQMGLWQGRVDAARGLDYQEKMADDDENANAYNLGYYRGYSEYESNRRGWDQATRDAFDQKYVNC